MSGSVSFGNSANGISMFLGGLVRDNVARFNGNYGLSLDTQVGYVHNAAAFNEVGDVTSGVQLGSNLCGNALCP